VAGLRAKTASPRTVNGAKVLCIGNINAGGSGKTPAAIAVMRLLKASNHFKRPVFLLRGYGGSLKGPLRVDPATYNPSHVGEEALLLSTIAETYIAADRYAGAAYAAAQGADMIIMDDGLQNASLRSDMKLVVVSGAMGFGNGHLIPAGPLRETLASGLQKADGFLLIGDDTRGILGVLPEDKPVFHGRIITPPEHIPSKDHAYLAFAAIGYPQKFFDYVRDILSLNIAETKSFADHHHYSESDILSYVERAKARNLKLLTTEKDAQTLRRLKGFDDADIVVLPMSVSFESSDNLVNFILGTSS
jgi:tetraacyldisaccharide 4'-kinase